MKVQQKKVSTSSSSCIALLYLISFLYSSCYSYRKIDTDYNDIEPNQKYEITTKKFNKERMVITTVTDSAIVALKGRSEIITPLLELKRVKRRKYSNGKTILLSTIVYLASFRLLAIPNDI